MEVRRSIFLKASIYIEMNFVKVISNAIQSGFRKIKIKRNGNYDIQNVNQSTPFGVDSSPLKGMVAIYADTNKRGKAVIIGYLNKSLIAAEGENRIYSLKSNGSISTYIWLKADETMEIGGSANFMVRFNELKSGFDTLKSDLNDMKSKWNAFTAAYVPGGPANVGLPATLAGQTSPASTASIDSAKIEEIKTL